MDPFNPYSASEEKMDKIEEMVTNVRGLEEIHDRVRKIRETIHFLVQKFYNPSLKSMDDKKDELKSILQVPEKQMEKQIDRLKKVIQEVNK
jgi:hypothetical protein